MDKAKQPALFMMIGGVAMALGSFLAWGTASFGGVSVSASGMDGGDGWMTLIGGAALAAFGYAKYSGAFNIPKWAGWAGVGLGLAVALLNLFDILDAELSLGIGMYVILVGGALGIYGLLQDKA
jgi:hypothetical protein